MSQQDFQFSYAFLTHWHQLHAADQHLVDQANLAMQKAYAPYSNFKVGASVLLENGQIICGSNQENVAFPSGLCAERVALNYVGANFPDVAIDTLCVVARGELMPEDHMLSPCGGCRQVMLESENRQVPPIRVILVNQDHRTIILNAVRDLLPFGFGK